jgi:hypothetical protein
MDSLISISTDGTIAFVYDDLLAPLVEEGESSIRRASHVEPHAAGGWSVDLSPMGGPVLPERFALRRDALAAEKAWIEEHLAGAIGD